MYRTTAKSIIINYFILICLLGSLLAIGCTEANQSSVSSASSISSATPKYGGTLKMSKGADGQVSGFPPKLGAGNDLKQVNPAIETLFRIDTKGNLVPWLATDYKADATTKTITLTLRKGVKFHDGTDFNAAAVKWNLGKCMDVKKQGTEKFKSIDVVDDYTIRINLTEWDSTIPAYLCMYVGAMISPTAYQKNGEGWVDKNPVGTGPFQFVSWARDVKMVFKKFDNYWQKGKPYLDGIEWVPIVDSTVAALALRNGEIDVRTGIEYQDRAGLENGGFIIDRVLASSSGVPQNPFITSSALTSSPFSNVKVRQAVSYAIDSAIIVKNVYKNEGIPINQWAAPGTWAYNHSVVGYPYNPTKAKTLLVEAGYPNGFNTKIIGTNSIRLTMTAMQGYLKEIGINAEIEGVEIGRYTQFVREGAKWDGILMGAVSPFPDPVAALSARYIGKDPKAYSQLLIPSDYQQAILNSISAYDNETKQKYMWEGIKLMIDKHCLAMPLWSLFFASASSKYVKNYEINLTPENSSQWSPEEAWLDK